jgi:pimeloyl-ACP methyl ester carboxylesterase
VFAREVVAHEHRGEDLPYLLFLQGGPGYPSPRPIDRASWMGVALERYRVLLLDYRGTGLSTPVTGKVARGLTGAQVADYLVNFCTDSIIADAELIRHQLTGGEKWAVLGQSYGGFCAVSYLSLAPQGLREVYITGGLPAFGHSIEDVYRATYRRLSTQNVRYATRYPQDRELVWRIVTKLRESDVRLVDGSPLTVERFQHLGVLFGYSYGLEEVHYVLETAFDLDGEFSEKFLADVHRIISYVGRPLYAVMQEPVYADDQGARWAAHRLLKEFPQFSSDVAVPLFTGEMMYPSLFDHDPGLIPFREAADILANRTDWPRLYDVEALRRCTVPVAACVYVDDMYVERQFSEETADMISSMRVWITNEFMHDGLRNHGERVLGRLMDMVRGRA